MCVLRGGRQRAQASHLAVLLAVQGGPGKLGGPLALGEQRAAFLLKEQELLQQAKYGKGGGAERRVGALCVGARLREEAQNKPCFVLAPWSCQLMLPTDVATLHAAVARPPRSPLHF